jgi:hypothetical protein
MGVTSNLRRPDEEKPGYCSRNRDGKPRIRLSQIRLSFSFAGFEPLTP